MLIVKKKSFFFDSSPYVCDLKLEIVPMADAPFGAFIWNLAIWNLEFTADMQPRFNRDDSGKVKGLTLVKDVRLKLLSNTK